MAELLDELGYPTEVTKSEVVSAFLQVLSDLSFHDYLFISVAASSRMGRMLQL